MPHAQPGVPLDVMRRGARGALALALRQALAQLASVAAAVVLARVLTRAEFGVYGITVFVMNFLVVFGDAGLAAGLVREREEPSDDDYRAVFTFQQALVAVLALAGFVAAPSIAALLSRDLDLVPLVRAAALALVLASFQSVPTARLERHLRFDRLAVVEVAQALAFNAVAVACALGGLGATSMAAALVARAATGAVAVRLVEPWPARWRWDWPRVRARLRFGLGFQGAAFVNMLRDALVPVFVGATLGSAAVGGIFFARMLSFYPFVVVYMLQRLLLPMFARLQHDAAGLRRAASASLFAVAAAVVPVQALVFALQEPIVRVVFGEPWVTTLAVYRWLWLASVLEPQLVVGIALLNALGRSARTLRFVVTTTALTWVLGVPLLLLAGPVGYGIATTALLVVKQGLVGEVDEASGLSTLAVVAPVWAAGLGAGALVAVLSAWWAPAGVLSLGALLAAGLVAYGALLLALAGGPTRAALAWLRSELRRVPVVGDAAGLASGAGQGAPR